MSAASAALSCSPGPDAAPRPWPRQALLPTAPALRLHQFFLLVGKNDANSGQNGCRGPAHSRRITAFPAGCVAGSPFAPLIGHALGGTINGVFDPNDARVEVEREVHQCVMGSLLDRQARTCALKQKIEGLLLGAH